MKWKLHIIGVNTSENKESCVNKEYLSYYHERDNIFWILNIEIQHNHSKQTKNLKNIIVYILLMK